MMKKYQKNLVMQSTPRILEKQWQHEQKTTKWRKIAPRFHCIFSTKNDFFKKWIVKSREIHIYIHTHIHISYKIYSGFSLWKNGVFPVTFKYHTLSLKLLHTLIKHSQDWILILNLRQIIRYFRVSKYTSLRYKIRDLIKLCYYYWNSNQF